MKKKLLALLLIAAMTVTMATGCGNKEEGTKDSVVIAITNDVDTLDPLNTSGGTNYQVYRNIFDTLVKEADDGSLISSLAEDWTVSEDGLTYTFQLRKDVTFHNGDPMTAKDVVFSLETAKASPHWADHTASIKEAKAIDDSTVEVKLNYQYAPFLLAMTFIYIVPEDAYKEAGEGFAQNPIGTGPYAFVSHATGQNIQLTRNDAYFGTLPAIKDVTFEVLTESSTALVALETGDVDFAQDLAASQVSVAKDNDSLNVKVMESTGLVCIALNNDIKPFDDVKVRQAINYAINKDSVIAISQDGMASAAVSPFNDAYFGYSDKVKGYEYNIDKAKALLKEAGYPNGFDITLKVYDAQSLPKDAQVVQEELGKINVNVKIEMMEANAYLQDIFNGNYEMGALTASSSLTDIDNWDQFLMTGAGMNLFKYSNGEVDKLFTDAKKMDNDKDRLAAYEKLTQIVVDDAAMVPLYFMSRTYIASKNLQVHETKLDGVHGIPAYALSWAE